jgi:HAD superfamily hydrolase (TIGR01456 family)
MDGVLTRGKGTLDGTRETLEFLAKARMPFVLLSNSGGVTEAEKARVLSAQLGVNVEADQIVQGHTPMRLLGEGAGPLRNTQIIDNGVPRQRFGPNDHTLIIGPRSAVAVAESYGFWQPLHVRDVQARRAELVPLKDWSGDATFWGAEAPSNSSSLPPGAAPRIVAVCVMAPNGVDAFNDLQIVLDAILALPAGQIGSAAVSQRQELPVYFAGDDLLYMGEARTPRLGLGAIREMWTSVVESVTGRPLHAIMYGKPPRIS